MVRVARFTAIVFSACALASIPAVTQAVTAERSALSGFVSFNDFIHATAKASYRSYTAASRNGGVRSSAAFTQMRSYILNLYHGVQVGHSFILDGRYVDCVTIDSQPSAQGQRIGKIPPAPKLSGASHANSQPEVSPLTLGLHDAYGNAISCPNGTIPMPRVSLSETTAFPDMTAYLNLKPATLLPHRYATGGEAVKNRGVASTLSIWNPKGDFSLSQVWVTAGRDSGRQTVEAGWIHDPARFHTKDAVPFIFFTPNNNDWEHTRWKKPCYNLDCAHTFVQLDKNFMLGMPFPHYSTVGGKQYYLSIEWLLTDSRWYLYVDGKTLGYYPVSLFDHGAMSKHGEEIHFGGEASTTEDSAWPPMGSGEFASAGAGKAASQTGIGYFTDTPLPVGQAATLSPYAPYPKCYTITIANLSGPAPGNTYIYFGGPGGKC